MDDDLRLLLDAMQADTDQLIARTTRALTEPTTPEPRRRWWRRSA